MQLGGPRSVFSAEQTLHDAESALGHAFHRGAATTVVFNPAVREAARSRLSTESELRAALERGELVAYYQPIVGMAGRRVHGFEALARWRKADGQLVPPAVFVPVAEATGPSGIFVSECENARAGEHADRGRREGDRQTDTQCPRSSPLDALHGFDGITKLGQGGQIRNAALTHIWF